MAQLKHEFDLTIAGGGATGLSLALALQHTCHLSIAVIDAGPDPQSKTQASEQSGDDLRSVALSAQSCDLLHSWGVHSIHQLGCAIEHIHVSDQGNIGNCQMHAADYQLNAMGRVIGLAQLVDALQQCHAQSKAQTQFFYQQRIDQVNRTANEVQIELTDGTLISSRLLAITEGGASSTRQKVGIEISAHDYQQTAIVANVTTDAPHKNWAFERFTSQGPIAMLPLANNSNPATSQCSLVWTLSPARAEQVMAMPDDEFCRALQASFGTRLGNIVGTSARGAFDLHLQQAQQHIHHRTALLGNACQSLHPIAGQGLNLGLRDVQALVTVLQHAPQDIGAFGLLNKYQAARKSDQQKLVLATHSLVYGFSNSLLPLVVGRNMALTMLNHSQHLQQWFALNAMGYSQSGDKHATL